MDAVKLGRATVAKETEKAIYVEFEADDHDDMWIPKAVIHDDSEVWCHGQEGVVCVQSWWADKSGLT